VAARSSDDGHPPRCLLTSKLSSRSSSAWSGSPRVLVWIHGAPFPPRPRRTPSPPARAAPGRGRRRGRGCRDGRGAAAGRAGGRARQDVVAKGRAGMLAEALAEFAAICMLWTRGWSGCSSMAFVRHGCMLCTLLQANSATWRLANVVYLCCHWLSVQRYGALVVERTSLQ
jgi:hypothetical protein